jgi:hypothetical protein
LLTPVRTVHAGVVTNHLYEASCQSAPGLARTESERSQMEEKAKKQSQVQNCLDELSQVTATLGEALDALEHRLGPVLRDQEPILTEDEARPEQLLVPLAHELRLRTGQLHDHVSAIRLIMDRLEL